MDANGFAGPQIVQAGAKPVLSAGRSGEAFVSEWRGRYASLAYWGKLWRTITGQITIAAANNSPLAANGQPIVGIWNPPNSGKNVELIRVTPVTVSGTPGGPLLYNMALGVNSITAAANLVPNGGLLSSTAQTVAKLFANVALTGAPAQTLYGLAAGCTAVAASGVAQQAADDRGGGIIIPPGGLLSIASSAAGTTHIVQVEIEAADFEV